MNSKMDEMIVWLLLEYRAKIDKINTQGLQVLTELRDEWTIEKADEMFKRICHRKRSKL